MSTHTFVTDEIRLPRWRQWLARGLEMIIGAILLLAGLLKAWEPMDFVRQITDYKIITAPGIVKPLAWAMIALECGLGAALIAGYRRRQVLPLAMGLFVVFLGAVGWAWVSGATADCGCFGSWAKRTPAEAFAEDLLMLAALVVAWFIYRVETPRFHRMRFGVVCLAMLAGLFLTGWASRSVRQSTDPVTRLQAQAQNPVSNLNITGLAVDLKTGTHLIMLMDTGCAHCQASVPAFNQLLTQQQSTSPLIALCSNMEAEVTMFKKNFQAQFPLGRISREDFMRLLERGDTPRTLLVKDGVIRKIWDGNAPQETEIGQALAAN